MRQIDATLAAFGPDPRFGGAVSGRHLAPEEDPRLHAYLVRFEAGGHTAWHSHEHGQLLICTEGHGFVGTRDGQVIELRPGIAVWTDAGQEHWHGAGFDASMTHVAAQTETPGNDDAVRWREPVEQTAYDQATGRSTQPR